MDDRTGSHTTKLSTFALQEIIESNEASSTKSYDLDKKGGIGVPCKHSIGYGTSIKSPAPPTVLGAAVTPIERAPSKSNWGGKKSKFIKDEGSVSSGNGGTADKGKGKDPDEENGIVLDGIGISNSREEEE
ncbi:hypothetical protein Adt_15406 [Abeliophyllum distichum]|uniref:Uncharacterized protein n=1 Tax=Abeliophyllum distichum TaxID=126358 RepID=A0ABD1U2D9_9LAMI